MGAALGLSIDFLAAGMLAALATLCIMSLHSRTITVYARIAYPLGFAISFMAVQVLFHREPLLAAGVRPFVTWILALVIIQSLCLRPGFLHRFVFVCFGIGLLTLPYLKGHIGDVELERARLDQAIAISNPNELAAWFGFCAVYFVILGLETKRNVVRITSWLVGMGCIYIVGLTVSRGALFVVMVAAVVAFRRLLRHGFIPVLFLIMLSWGIYESGLFERAAASYAVRATEETGRLLVWPLVLQRLSSSPLMGVGLSRIATYVPGIKYPITPHNVFLYIGLSSGIIPLALFVASWWRAAKGALHSNAQRLADAPFHLPLLLYAFLIVQQSNASFMNAWVIVTLAIAIAAGVSNPVRRMARLYPIRGDTSTSIRRSRKVGNGLAGA
jgi:O-antigen ligase